MITTLDIVFILFWATVDIVTRYMCILWSLICLAYASPCEASVDVELQCIRATWKPINSKCFQSNDAHCALLSKYIGPMGPQLSSSIIQF